MAWRDKMKKRSVKTKIALRITNSILHMLLNVAFYCVALFVIVKACTIAYDFSYQIFGNVTMTDSDHAYERQVVIEEHESTMSVASKLELYKLIDNKYSFYVRAKIGDESIKSGEFIISSDMNYDEIIDVITSTPTDSEDSDSSTSSESLSPSTTDSGNN